MMEETIRANYNIPFVPEELRWCVFGFDKNGKVEWLETVNKQLAFFAKEAGNRAGGNFQVQKLKRGEIRSMFGNPEWVDWREKRTDKPVAVSFERNGFGVLVSTEKQEKGEVEE